MKFNIENLSRELSEGFVSIIKTYNHTLASDGIKVYLENAEDNYIKVTFDGDRLCISAKRPSHYYRGFCMFLMNPVSFLEEHAYFEDNAIMLDCSRNAVWNLDTLKEYIQLCAGLGINQIMLYMEDTYEVEGYPYFGAFRGRYTYETLHEVDNYAAIFGIEMIPCIQTLAHLHTFLRWSESKCLKDTDDILLVGDEKVIAFVKAIIQSATKPFRTNKIHLGMDEAHELGLGEYLRKHGYMDRFSIMQKHLEVVETICRDLGLEPMIWSDMYFRLMSPTGDYYDLDEDIEFPLISKIPENMTLVYWDYYHHSEEAYHKNIKLHKKLTDQICYAGGGWTWNGITPNYEKAVATLRAGMKASRKENISKTTCTFWMDNGTETPLATSLYAIIYYAELCFHDSVDWNRFDKILRFFTGVSKDAFELLDKFDNLPGAMKENENADNPSKYLYYQDILQGLFDVQIKDIPVEEHYRDLKERLNEIEILKPVRFNLDVIFSYYRELAGVLELKSDMGLKIRQYYLDGNVEELSKISSTIKECEKYCLNLKELREKIWFKECKPNGFEVLDIRMGGVVTRLQSCYKRIQAYMNREIPCMAELEEERLPYCIDSVNSNHKLCACNSWQNIVSAGNIAGI